MNQNSKSTLGSFLAIAVAVFFATHWWVSKNGEALYYHPPRSGVMLTTVSKAKVTFALANAFSQANPGWALWVQPWESRHGLQKAANGELDPMPVLYSPSVPACVESLNRAWTQSEGKAPQPRRELLNEADPGQDLRYAYTPLVFVTTPAFAAANPWLGQAHPWMNLWQRMAGKTPGSAPFHFSFADPNAGSGVYILGMVHDDWVQCHPGVTEEQFLTQIHTGAIVDYPARAGTTKLFQAYSAEVTGGSSPRAFIVSYESTVLRFLKDNPKQAGQIVVVYPRPVPKVSERLAVLNGSWNSGDFHDMCLKFTDFVKSRQGQSIVEANYLHPVFIADTLLDKTSGHGIRKLDQGDYADAHSGDELARYDTTMIDAARWQKLH